MRKILNAILIVLVLALLNATFWTWIYRSPSRSWPGYLFFAPRVIDLREAAYRLGLKSIPPGELNKYQARLRSDPADADAAFILGYIFYRAGNLREAVAQFERARENGFEPGKLHYWLGRAYLESGRRDQALKEYNRGLVRLDHPLALRFALQLGL